MYVLTAGEYSDYRIKGVYSTREKAESVKVHVEDANDIEEYELDVMLEVPDGHSLFSINMKEDGTVFDPWGRNNISPGLPDGVEILPVEKLFYLKFDGSSDAVYYAYQPRTAYRCFYVIAKDSTHAIKIANERRAQLIALNQFKYSGQQ